jgi:hypothetical protein
MTGSDTELIKPSESKMITVKHRWKRNKTDTCGNVIISFDKNGIAKVPHVGNNIIDVELYVQSSRNLAKIVSVGDVVMDSEEKVLEPKVVVKEPEVKKVSEDITVKVDKKVVAVESEEEFQEEIEKEIKKPKTEEVHTKKPVRPPKKR